MTLVNVGIASFTSVTGWTLALESVNFIDASGVVFARCTEPLINVEFAMITRKSRTTETIVAANSIEANTVNARRFTSSCVTFVYVHFAIFTLKIIIIYILSTFIMRKMLMSFH